MAQVQLILKEEVYGLGEAGDLVSVKPGYARNFLLPQRKAEIATTDRVKAFEHQKAVIAEKLAKEMKDVEAVKQRIEKLHLEFEAAAGDSGRLFGSVTSMQIAEQLAEKGFEIDRRKIELKDPIKSVGEHQVTVRVRREVIATVKLTVTGVAAAAGTHEEVEEEISNLGGAPSASGDAAAGADDDDRADDEEQDDDEDDDD